MREREDTLLRLPNSESGPGHLPTNEIPTYLPTYSRELSRNKILEGGARATLARQDMWPKL